MSEGLLGKKFKIASIYFQKISNKNNPMQVITENCNRDQLKKSTWKRGSNIFEWHPFLYDLGQLIKKIM